MIVIAWNCQGAASKGFLRAAKELLRAHRPDFFACFEPKVAGIHADSICRKIGFRRWLRVEAVGYSGGIWIFWNDNWKVDVRLTHPQFVVLDISHGNEINKSLALVYASPSHQLRRKLWEGLSRSTGILNNEWLAIGDFNSVATREEVSNKEGFDSRRCRDFNKWIFDEGLVDIGFTGPKFTWTRGVKSESFKGARLDRALCTTEWITKFPHSKVTHLTSHHSDHLPIMVRTEVAQKWSGANCFKFQAAWTTHDTFADLMERSWNKNESLMTNNKNIVKVLKEWNQDTFGNISKRKRRIHARLRGIQRHKEIRPNNGLLRLEKKLRGDLEEVLMQEELIWYQKSREEWITSGDRNTRFYHASTVIRRNRSRVEALKNNEDDWITDPEELKKMVRDFFTKVFSEDNDDYNRGAIRGAYPVISQEKLNRVQETITGEEVRKALFQMAPWKAPGPDGLSAGFYQKTWTTTGENLINHVKDFMRSGQMPNGLNDTLIALIPKVETPERVSQLRPISLCNVNYKVITKVLANRLKSILPDLIGPDQSSFVPGRQITDNIAVYQEALHLTKKGRKGYMMFKIDLEKAYDRLSWNFIRSSLKEIGLSEHWTSIIMKCVETSKLTIMWNGEKLENIIPERGIRQGDSISPYIFVICMERLSHLIKNKVTQGKWKGIKMARKGPEISHLFFADDMVLFGEALPDQIQSVKDCLTMFERVSGQRVNLQKSQVYFSTNVDRAKAEDLAGLAGIKQVHNMGSYLGVPSIQGRVKKDSYAYILDRVNSKLDGWKMKFLSFAGRQIMAQTILNTIPYYSMQTMFLPVGVLEQIEQKIRTFLWGGSENKRRCNLVSWDHVT